MTVSKVKIINIDDKRNEKEVDQLTHFRQTGSSGTDISAGVFTEEYLSKLTGKESATIYDEMRRSDDQIGMLLRLIKNPILSAQWDIEAVDDSPEELEIRDFARFVFFENMGNPATGKIKTWKNFITECMTCVDFGYSLFEISHKVVLNDPEFGDYIGIKELGWRSPKTIEEWNLNHDGSINNVRQLVVGDLQRDTNMKGVYLFVVTPHKEGDNYEGVSDLRQIYGNWFRKNYFRKLQMIGVERGSTGVPIGTVPSGKIDSPEQLVLEDILQRFVMHEKSYIIQPEGWEVGQFKIKHETKEIINVIDQENEGMSKRFLANFMELGIGRSGGGSFALGQDLSDMFLSGIQFYPDMIIDLANIKLMKPIIDAKWGKRRFYPKFSVTGINDKRGKEFADVMTALKGAGLIQDSAKVKAFLHKTYKLPEFNEEEEKKIEKVDKTSIESEENFNEINLSEVQSIIFDKDIFTKDRAVSWLKDHDFKASKFDEKEETFRFRQQSPKLFTRFETKSLTNGIQAIIGFKPDESTLTELVDSTNNSVSKMMDKSANEVLEIYKEGMGIRGQLYIDDVMSKVNNSSKSKVLKEIEALSIPNKAFYKSTLQMFYAQLIDKSTNQVLSELKLTQDMKFNDIDDLGKDVPSATRTGANNEVDLIVNTQDNELIKQVTFTVNQNLEKLSPDQLNSQLQKLFDAYLTGATLRVGADNSTANMINLARNAVFQIKEIFDGIESFVFSNPSPKAAVCVNLTGRVFTKEEYLTTSNLPALHHGCNSFIRAQTAEVKGNKPVDPLGLSFTGTDIQVEKIIKSKTF